MSNTMFGFFLMMFAGIVIYFCTHSVADSQIESGKMFGLKDKIYSCREVSQ